MKDLVLEQISKRFGDKEVLRDLTITFPAGRTTCIMGPSGCGKTTLLRLLLGLEQPDGGHIHNLPPTASAVFQENRLFYDFSALSNVAAVFPKRADRDTIAQHLIQLGLGDSLHVPAGTLSGGMKRRVAIARAILAPGELVVMDEPFTGLDEDTKRLVLNYVKTHIRNRTLLLVTHDPLERDLLASHTFTLSPPPYLP